MTKIIEGLVKSGLSQEEAQALVSDFQTQQWNAALNSAARKIRKELRGLSLSDSYTWAAGLDKALVLVLSGRTRTIQAEQDGEDH